jgi:hypothetical protein
MCLRRNWQRSTWCSGTEPPKPAAQGKDRDSDKDRGARRTREQLVILTRARRTSKAASF